MKKNIEELKKDLDMAKSIVTNTMAIAYKSIFIGMIALTIAIIALIRTL